MLRWITAFMALTPLAACGNMEMGMEGEMKMVAEANFALTGAQAVGLIRTSDAALSVNAPQGTLVSIGATGEVKQASNADIVSFSAVKGGIYVRLRNGERYLVKSADSSKTKIETSGEFSGQNEQGDLIFSDASIFRAKTSKLEKLSTVLEGVRVQSLSGNFAVLGSDTGVFQIFDTVTSARYNIMACNGPQAVALSSSKAAINDCQVGQEVIDMTNGMRTTSAISIYNHEALPTMVGAVFLSQTCPGTGSGYGLCGVDTAGAVTKYLDRTLSPGSAACSNCGAENSVLFGTDSYFVVRELTQVTYFKASDLSSGQFLAGLNVAKLSVKGSTVYYAAEDNFGKPKVGRFDLATMTDTPLSIPVAGDIERIAAIPN